MVKHRSCLTFYTLLLFVLIVGMCIQLYWSFILIFITAQITIGALLYKNVLNPNTTLDAVWAGITPADRSKIQEWGSCCGFNGPTDRPELTGKCATPALLSSPGCYPAMEKQFNSSSLAILISALVFLGFEILGFAICLLISFGCCKTEEQKLRERPVFV